MSSELIGELGQVGLTIGQSPVSNNTTTPVGCTGVESSPERKRQWSVTSSGRPVNRKRFRQAWLMFDIFKDWLRPHPSPELANCIVCNRVIKAGKSELEKHAAGKRHLSMLNGMTAGGGGVGGGAAEGRQTRGHTRHMVILDQDVVDVDSSYDGLKVVGMGLDGGLVHSEVVVMEEEMVVSSATLVYQEQLPAVITAYNGNVLLPPDSAEITTTQSSEITQTVKFAPTSMDEMGQDIVSSDDVSQEKVADSNGAVRNTTVKLHPSMSLEELGCHDNNTVIEEEVCCQENCSTTTQKLKTRDSVSSISTSSSCKSYACTPDPGTATRRGGPGPTKRHSQRYRPAWERFPEFKDWLTSHHNVYRAVCRICNKVLLADFTVIKAHATGRRHMYLAEKVTKGKQRIPTRRAETYLEEHVEGLTVSSESGTMSGGAEGEVSYKEDYDRNLADLNRSNSGAGGGTATGSTQSSDISQPNYTTGIYVPQQRNVPPAHNLSKAVVMSPAPNWKATAIVNGHVTRLDLSDYVGRYLILVFYPQDFSKICASEINALSDRSYEFRSIQTEIVACSVDSHLCHLTWSKLSRADGGVSLPKIPLIADPTHAIARAYGVFLPDKGHTLRAHFIIDKRGILRHMCATDTLVGRGTDELLRIVKALQYVDEVEEAVPADWTQPNE